MKEFQPKDTALISFAHFQLSVVILYLESTFFYVLDIAQKGGGVEKNNTNYNLDNNRA